MILAADDGIFTGSFNLADILLLIAVIVFGIAFFVRLLAKPISIDFVCIAAGLTCTALALLVV